MLFRNDPLMSSVLLCYVYVLIKNNGIFIVRRSLWLISKSIARYKKYYALSNSINLFNIEKNNIKSHSLFLFFRMCCGVIILAKYRSNKSASLLFLVSECAVVS